jgi:hypothetical protein
MPLLTDQNIEAELSYAYLHAVAAKAGMSCQASERNLDSAGIDAAISARDQFASNSIFTEITLHVQLKATTKQPAGVNGNLSYFMEDVGRYDRLRSARAIPPRILAVLFLPAEAAEWLTWTEDRLALQRCAYWISLRGAPPTTNRTGQTVYLPRNHVFSPEGLRGLMTRLSCGEEVFYEQ